MKLNKLYTYLILAFLVGFNACTSNFEDINAPKYEVSDEDMQGDNFALGAFFPQLQDNAFPAQENSYQMNENLIGDVYGRYMMTSNDGWNSSNFSVYNAPEGWVKYPFNDVMSKIYTAWNEIRKQTDGEGVNFAWAQILRVAAMQRITDMYGPIPYTKVDKGDLKVAYDSQEDVYKAMFEDLTNAIDVLTTYVSANPASRPMADFDGVYAGDYKQWVRFANSLKLRMAIRVRFADPALAKEMAEEAVNHTIGVMESNADNATYNYSKGNPIYVMWSSYTDTRVAADITSYMNGFEDPRRAKYFKLSTIDGAEDQYVGLRSGAAVTSKAWALEYSAPNVERTDALLWMSASEMAFAKAEGAVAGWNMGGTAEYFYNQGIKLSFEQWGVSGADDYLNNSARTQANYNDPKGKYPANASSTITIKWDDSVSEVVKLERIITQKWIALWPIGQEAWSEYRRTGFPHIFPVAQNVSPSIPVANRIPFSSDEYLNNAENMPAALQHLGGSDNYATKLWWDKYRN